MRASQSERDDTSLAALRARYGLRHRWLSLLTVMVGSMAAIMASTIVNVAVPDMARHFPMGHERSQWVASGFMLAMTVSMLTTPWLLERFGYRATYVGSVLALGLGGVVGGLAGSYELVLAMRVLEGLAAGVLQPIPAIIILRAFEPHEQGRAMGIFGFGVVLAPAIGPSIGGVLVDSFGWRSIFFVVVPFSVVATALAFRYLATTAPGGKPTNAASRLDAWGLLLGAVCTVSLLNALTQFNQAMHGKPLWPGVAMLALSAAAGVAFWRWQQRQMTHGLVPLMDLHLFAHRPFAMGGIVAFIYGAALFGSTYLIPVFLQEGLMHSASTVGVLLLPAGLVLAVVITIAGRLADRVPIHQLVTVGLALLAISFALMALVGLQTSLWVLLALAVLGRVGLGCVLPSLNLGAMRGLDKELIAQASSTINFLRQLGGAAGVSVVGIVLEWRLDVWRIHGTASTRPLVAYGETFLVLAVVCALAGVAAWRMRSPTPPAPVPAERT
jgi:EmrB/QacA subfamily drug resistance transporter